VFTFGVEKERLETPVDSQGNSKCSYSKIETTREITNENSNFTKQG
jgi:hypothetical protein